MTDEIVRARHNKPIRVLTILFTLFFNLLFLAMMIGVWQGSTEISDDPNATESENATVVVACIVMFVAVPWLATAQVFTFSVALTDEGIRKTSLLAGTVFIRYEDIDTIKYGNWLQYFIIKGKRRRIVMAPYLEGFESFCNALWGIAARKGLTNLLRENIARMKLAGALGWRLRLIRLKLRKEEDSYSPPDGRSLEQFSQKVDQISAALKSQPYQRMKYVSYVLIFSAIGISVWAWLDMLFDPSSEMYWAELSNGELIATLALASIPILGLATTVSVRKRRFWGPLAGACMASCGVGFLFGIPAIILVIIGRKQFEERG